jgi:hypothetical protein
MRMCSWHLMNKGECQLSVSHTIASKEGIAGMSQHLFSSAVDLHTWTWWHWLVTPWHSSPSAPAIVQQAGAPSGIMTTI